jgi:hypothetical protein
MTRDPYLIQGPAQISFSGGRSSAYMLVKIVEAHGGTLPDDVIVSFANTGKEREETLAFVQKVADHLGVAVHWIEFDHEAKRPADRWREVSFTTAARNGEPFAALTDKYLPNPLHRVCTQHLKIEPMDRFRKSIGFPDDCALVCGIRSDEPRRVARMRARTEANFVLPLAEAGVNRDDVLAFWRSMPFDLDLDSGWSNCDLCYLKGAKHLIGLIRAEPSRADWWIKQEAGRKLFRIDRPNYATLKLIATQPQLFDAEEEEALPCECTD